MASASFATCIITTTDGVFGGACGMSVPRSGMYRAMRHDEGTFNESSV